MIKNIIIVVLTLSLVIQGFSWGIDKQCRKYEGWEFYSIFPEPMCHVESQIVPLRELKKIFDSPQLEQDTY